MPAQSTSWTQEIRSLGGLRVHLVQPPRSVPIEEAIVLCHGFGAPGDDLVGIAEWLIRQLQANGRSPLLAFPEAPIDLEDFGMPGARAWWPINMARLLQLAAAHHFDQLRNEVPPGIDEARSLLAGALDVLLDSFSLDDSQLSLGGFSQGAMLATDTVLRGRKDPPRQLIVLSGALICESLWSENAAKLGAVDVIQTHGEQDTILPIQTGRWLNELLRQHAARVDYLEFNGPHTIPMEVIDKISQRRDSMGDRRARKTS